MIFYKGVILLGCCMLIGCTPAKSLPYSSHQGAMLFKLVRNPEIKPLLQASKYSHYLEIKDISELPETERKLAYRQESHSKTDPTELTSVSYYFAFNEALNRVVNGSSPSACYYIDIVCDPAGRVLGIEYFSRSQE